MASKRIPDLTSYTPASTDLLVVYDAGTDTTKSSTISSLIPNINNLQFKVLAANATGTDVSTAQAWFPSAGAVTVESGTTYKFEGYLRTSRSAGTTSHTTSLLFGGTATLTNIAWRADVNTGDVVTNAAQNQVSAEVATATVVKAASTSATEQISIKIEGIVRVNAGGTFIPQFQYSSAAGGAPSILTNSYFMLYPLGSGSVTTQGTWS